MQDTVWTKNLGEIKDLRYHPSGDYIIISTSTNIQVLDANNGEVIRSIHEDMGAFSDFTLSPSGDTIVTNIAGYMKLYDFKTGDSIDIIDDYYQLERYRSDVPPYIYDLEFTPDGNYIVSCGSYNYNSELMERGVVLIHDIKKDALVKATIDSSMTCVAVSPVGDYFATGTLYEGTVDLWDIGTWEKVKTLGVHDISIHDLDFSNDGKY